MNDSQKVDAYLLKHTQWSNELAELRSIFRSTELKEEIKWGSPTYTLNGQLVAGMAAFKNHYAIWFHQGFFLKDNEKKLINAQEGKTQALRQWKFQKGDRIDSQLVLSYINEAIENSKAGKKVKAQKRSTLAIPQILEAAFNNNSDIEIAFLKLTLGKQHEYADYISEAKKEETRLSRLEKCIPLIIEGKGLHNKYKKC